jgi:hypothetical protein
MRLAIVSGDGSRETGAAALLEWVRIARIIAAADHLPKRIAPSSQDQETT